MLLVLVGKDRLQTLRFMRTGLVRLYMAMFFLCEHIAYVQSPAAALFDRHGASQDLFATSLNRSFKRLRRVDRYNMSGRDQSAYDYVMWTFAGAGMRGELGGFDQIIETLKARPNLRRMLADSLATNPARMAIAVKSTAIAVKRMDIIMGVKVVRDKNTGGSNTVLFTGSQNSGDMNTRRQTTFVYSVVNINKALAEEQQANLRQRSVLLSSLANHI